MYYYFAIGLTMATMCPAHCWCRWRCCKNNKNCWLLCKQLANASTHSITIVPSSVKGGGCCWEYNFYCWSYRAMLLLIPEMLMMAMRPKRVPQMPRKLWPPPVQYHSLLAIWCIWFREQSQIPPSNNFSQNDLLECQCQKRTQHWFDHRHRHGRIWLRRRHGWWWLWQHHLTVVVVLK